jgi:hypothetical protein
VLKAFLTGPVLEERLVKEFGLLEAQRSAGALSGAQLEAAQRALVNSVLGEQGDLALPVAGKLLAKHANWGTSLAAMAQLQKRHPGKGQLLLHLQQHEY